jgi:hypothetical protein
VSGRTSNSETTSNGDVSRRRPWIAVALTIALPGLGHVYLRRFKRAVLWLVLYVASTTFLLSDETMPDSLSVEAIRSAGEAIPIEVTILIIGISALCLLDAYMLAREINDRARRASGEAPAHCPNCGEELDADLDFCHWCTARLDSEE